MPRSKQQARKKKSVHPRKQQAHKINKRKRQQDGGAAPAVSEPPRKKQKVKKEKTQQMPSAPQPPSRSQTPERSDMEDAAQPEPVDLVRQRARRNRDNVQKDVKANLFVGFKTRTKVLAQAAGFGGWDFNGRLVYSFATAVKAWTEEITRRAALSAIADGEKWIQREHVAGLAPQLPPAEDGAGDDEAPATEAPATEAPAPGPGSYERGAAIQVRRGKEGESEEWVPAIFLKPTKSGKHAQIKFPGGKVKKLGLEKIRRPPGAKAAGGPDTNGYSNKQFRAYVERTLDRLNKRDDSLAEARPEGGEDSARRLNVKAIKLIKQYVEAGVKHACRQCATDGQMAEEQWAAAAEAGLLGTSRVLRLRV